MPINNVEILSQGVYNNLKRAVKATFVLIPLFGVQLFVTIYRPYTTEIGGIEYERFSIPINNLQGFFVSLIFCFLNGEVTSHLKRTWRRRIRDRYQFVFKRSQRTLSLRSDAELSRNTEALSLRTASIKTHENGNGKRLVKNGGLSLSKDREIHDEIPLTELDNVR
ncbi:hypothetical protein KUTeg_008933 [Tegillarca granosa]|uniref:G-protein coupled receptors family 2 profile 2 domain-containing protein n=1 Tax=Tegillarca granosa TaxID=220873 RepID=A0ABQ9FD16_TEGGR|nr:hypothetical protein KUTeg_008933 [Tegillarca granosa]